MPSRAGIDPLNKLIDRNGEDNETDVTNSNNEVFSAGNFAAPTIASKLQQR